MDPTLPGADPADPGPHSDPTGRPIQSEKLSKCLIHNTNIFLKICKKSAKGDQRRNHKKFSKGGGTRGGGFSEGKIFEIFIKFFKEID